MTRATRTELESRLAHRLNDEVERLVATVDIRTQQQRLQQRLQPIRRRRRPLYMPAALVATAAVAVAVAVLVSTAASHVNATGPASGPLRAPATFTSEISPLAGLQLTWPTPGWQADDSASEVVIHPPGLSGAAIRIAKGLFPADPSGDLVSTRRSARSVIAALRTSPALAVSAPVREQLGDGLTALHADIRLSSSAPRSGFAYLVYRGNSVNATSFSIRQGMRVRIYTATYRAPYGVELLDIAVEAHSANELAQLTPLAERVLTTMHVPRGLVVSRAFHL